MIKIELRLFADLSKHTPKNFEEYQIDDNITIEQLLINLEIDLEKAKIIFINGRKKNLDHTLEQGDRVGIFPPVGGG